MTGDTKPTPFTSSMDNIPCQPIDAKVFFDAALIYDGDYLSKAIKSCGGTMQHINHFSREHCGCRPIDPWADAHDNETVVEALAATGEELKDE